MHETIICPGCQRRLLLPEECGGREVQCPSCQTQFPAQPSPPVLAHAADPAVLSRADASPASSGPERRRRFGEEDEWRPLRRGGRRRQSNGMAWVLGIVGGMVGLLLIGSCLGLVFFRSWTNRLHRPADP